MIPTMSTPQEQQVALEKIRQLPTHIEALVRGLTPEQLTTHFLPNEWTVAQNVHHLFDSHTNSYVRCKLILTEDNPPLKPYLQDAWAAMPDASAADIANSLVLLNALHVRWVQFWESLPESAWSRTGLHPDYGSMTLDRILNSYAAHGEAHIDQITRTLAAQAK